jgi:hypothetical protein
MLTYAGDSGSPIYLRNGQLIGVGSYFKYEGMNPANSARAVMFAPLSKGIVTTAVNEYLANKAVNRTP